MFKRVFGLGFVSFAIYTLYFSVFKKVNITIGALVMCFLIMDVFIYYKYKESLTCRFPFYLLILAVARSYIVSIFLYRKDEP